MNSILIITYVNLSASALLELKSEGVNLKFDQPSERLSKMSQVSLLLLN